MDLPPSPGIIRVDDGYDLIECIVDPARSALFGHVAFEAPEHVRWSILLETSELRLLESACPADELEDHRRFITHAGCWVEITGLQFPVTDWRQLEGQSTTVDFDDAEVHPIMPGNDGNFLFIHEHHVPHANRITLGPRRGNLFGLAWTFEPRRYPTEEGPEVTVAAPIQLREILVTPYLHKEPPLDKARRAAERYARPGDLGEPRREGNAVVFPLVAGVA